MSEKSIVVFKGAQIRRTWYEGAWWFAVVDVIQTLTDSKDVKQYIKKMRSRDPQLNAYWGTICTPLPFVAKDGKKRAMNAAHTEGLFRIVQAIPSPKAEPFKRWLARVGFERVQEIENPELAAKRMRAIYHAKGYDDVWIEKRIRGIAVRETLTKEWQERGVEEGREYGILTAEISQATFGMQPSEYKTFKGLARENLRDHMTDLELIFSMLGEASATEITRQKDAMGFAENRQAARAGGRIAGDARQQLEKETGKPVSTKENYLSRIADPGRAEKTPGNASVKAPEDDED